MWMCEALGWAPTWLWYILAICLLLYVWGIWPYITTTISLPGPKPTVLFGNILQMAKDIPQSDVRRFQEYGRAFVMWIGRNPVINITDADIAKQIFVKDFPNFINKSTIFPLSPIQKSMVVFLENERWKFVRSMLSPGFTSAKLRQMVPLVDSCLNRMIDNLSGYCKTGESFNVNSEMGALTMDVIGSVGFGIQSDVQKGINADFLALAKSAFSGVSLKRLPIMITALFPCLNPVCEAIGLTTESKEFTTFCVKMLKEKIKERRNKPSKTKDLLQLLLDCTLDDAKEALADEDVDLDALKLDNPKGNQKLTDLEVISQTILFLFAGFETTASALVYLLYNLAIHPECQDRLIHEIDINLQGAAPNYDNVASLPYLNWCLSETQRLYAPRRLPRISAEAVTINGVHIPANTRVFIQVYAIHHNEAYWPDPEKFDPERWSPEHKAARHPYAFLAFGAGPRNCVGMRLALMEIKMAVVSILQKFRFVRVPETEVPLILKPSPFVQPQNDIMLAVESR